MSRDGTEQELCAKCLVLISNNRLGLNCLASYEHGYQVSHMECRYFEMLSKILNDLDAYHIACIPYSFSQCPRLKIFNFLDPIKIFVATLHIGLILIASPHFRYCYNVYQVEDMRQ